MFMTRTILLAAATVTALVTAHQPAMTRERFLATKWRLTGYIFSMMPADGFSITFHPDGSVETRNLGGITRWSLDGNELVLSGDDEHELRGVRPIRMAWLSDRGMFRKCYLPSRIGLFIFPEGSKAPSIACDDVPTAVLKLQIALDKTTYQSGDRIVVTATLANVGNAPIDVRHSADETGRSDGFRVELTSEKNSGNALRDDQPPSTTAGIAEPLSPGATTSRQLLLNSSLGSLQPGRYRLKIMYEATYPDGQIAIDSEPLTLEIKAPAITWKR